MAKSRYTFHKREREKARKAKQEEKRARRMEAKKLRGETEAGGSEEASDIISVQPGPQLLPDRDGEENINSTDFEKEG